MSYAPGAIERVSLLEQYDDPDPQLRAIRIAAAQRDTFDGWVMFGCTGDASVSRAARALETSGTFKSTRASAVLPVGIGKAYRLVH